MEVLPTHVQKALKEVIDNIGIHNYKITLSPGSNKGDNYVGLLYRIEVIGLKNGKEFMLHLICKVPPPQWELDDNKKVHIPFEREIYIYDVILKLFAKFQNSKQISKDHKFTSFAVCYAASDNNRAEFLILEDLRSRSFVMFDKNKNLDVNHVSLVVTGLAKYHALSFAMRDQQPEKFHEITQFDSALYEIIGKQAFLDLCDFGLMQVLSALKENNMSEYYERVKNIKDNCEEHMNSCFNAIGSENFRIISHGDCWNNNIMFKYQNDIPVEICFLDWQVARFVSPVLDLAYFFYLSTAGEILNVHFDSFLDLYYQQLKKSVSYLGSDLDRLYPYEMFLTDFQKFGKFGVVFCSFALNFTLGNTETAPDVGELTNTENTKKSIQDCLEFKDDSMKNVYKERICDVVRHAVQRNYI